MQTADKIRVSFFIVDCLVPLLSYKFRYSLFPPVFKFIVLVSASIHFLFADSITAIAKTKRAPIEESAE